MLFQRATVISACVLLAAAYELKDVPAEFDTRVQWVGCGSQVVNQGQCGSCWATSATSVFGDRACIWLQENGEPIPPGGVFTGNRMFQKAGTCTGDGTMHMAHNHGCKRTAYFLSAQALVSCGTVTEDRRMFPESAGCNGGEAADAWRYFFLHGLTTMSADGREGCSTYTAGRCSGKDPHNNGCKSCSAIWDQCEDTGLAPKAFRVDSFGWIMEERLAPRAQTGVPRPDSDAAAMEVQVNKMQVELMTNGPLQVCIDYFSNFGGFFNANPNGIYNSTVGAVKSGGHCLNIIGWGTDQASGMPFWTVKNSWGPGFGNDGLFRFLRGVDLCGIESDVWVGCPEGSHCELTEGVIHNETYVPHGASAELIKARLDQIKGNLVRTSFAGSRRLTSTRHHHGKARGGYWHELTREEFCSRPFSFNVAHAFEKRFGEPTTPEIACEKAKRVWTQGGVTGMKIRVDFGTGKEDSERVIHIRPDGSFQ